MRAERGAIKPRFATLANLRLGPGQSGPRLF
jgi:hypothetical protein